jgi:hypothetical protein
MFQNLPKFIFVSKKWGMTYDELSVFGRLRKVGKLEP